MPPLPALPTASTAPETRVAPPGDWTVIAPPVVPLAVVVLPASKLISLAALKKTRPPADTALLALTIPFWAMMPP